MYLRVGLAIAITAAASLSADWPRLSPARTALAADFPSTTAAQNPEVILRRVPNDGIQPEAAIDSRGVLHLLYFAGEPAAGDLFYVRSTDLGATFSAPVRVNSQPGSAIATGTIRGGQLALGANGRIHVAWNGSDRARPRGPVNPDMKKPGAPFLYARSNAAVTAFEPQRNLSLHVYSIDGGGSIAADPAGHVYAGFHGNKEGGERGEDKRQVWLVRSDDDGKTFAEAEPVWDTPTGVCGCCQTKLLATSGGSLALLFRTATGNTNRDVFVLTSHDNGRSFTGSRVQPWSINACPMTSMSLTAAGNRLMAAWETAGQVYRGSVDPSGRVADPLPAPGKPDARKHPRLALSSDGTSMLLWTERTGWARGGSLAWQVFDTAGRPAGSIGAASGIPVWSFAAVVAKRDGGFVVFY
jgi:hypothetical protein